MTSAIDDRTDAAEPGPIRVMIVSPRDLTALRGAPGEGSRPGGQDGRRG